MSVNDAAPAGAIRRTKGKNFAATSRLA